MTRRGDFEYSVNADNPRGQGTHVVIRLSAMGGPLPIGATHRGRWSYRVESASGGVVVTGDDFRTRTPKTHREVASMISDALPDLYREDANDDPCPEDFRASLREA